MHDEMEKLAYALINSRNEYLVWLGSRARTMLAQDIRSLLHRVAHPVVSDVFELRRREERLEERWREVRDYECAVRKRELALLQSGTDAATALEGDVQVQASP